MATPSKTIMQLASERRMRDSNPIGFAIREHEESHHGLFSWSHGNRPSNTIPPCKPRK